MPTLSISTKIKTRSTRWSISCIMNSMRLGSYPGGCRLFYNSSCVCLEGRTILTLSPGMISKLSVSRVYTTPPSWMSYKENRLYSHNVLSRLA